jgi:hypothetical protein
MLPTTITTKCRKLHVTTLTISDRSATRRRKVGARYYRFDFLNTVADIVSS